MYYQCEGLSSVKDFCEVVDMCRAPKESAHGSEASIRLHLAGTPRWHQSADDQARLCMYLYSGIRHAVRCNSRCLPIPNLISRISSSLTSPAGPISGFPGSAFASGLTGSERGVT